MGERRVSTRLYRSGVLVAEGFPIEDVSEHVPEPENTIWVDITDPRPEDFDLIGEELHLHDLAVEDALTSHQRPKADRYASHLFITAYAVRLDATTGRLSTASVGAFVTHNALVTVHPSDGCDMAAVRQRWDYGTDLARHGVAYLLHGLLDHVVDSHFDAVRILDDAIELLEDLLFDDHPRDSEVQRRSFELRKSLVLLRRVVLPMRELVNTLMRRDLTLVDEAMTPYYQDVYDHVLRVSEWTESLRDLVTTILETNLTIQGNRLNTIMKKVTSWAAIIAVPTAVTGFYGQNVPYPGFGHSLGFWTSSVVMGVLSVTLYLAFRRRDWI
jgi:magnesium transporter